MTSPSTQPVGAGIASLGWVAGTAALAVVTALGLPAQLNVGPRRATGTTSGGPTG